jgi:hypothetical protein
MLLDFLRLSDILTKFIHILFKERSARSSRLIASSNALNIPVQLLVLRSRVERAEECRVEIGEALTTFSADRGQEVLKDKVA